MLEIGELNGDILVLLLYISLSTWNLLIMKNDEFIGFCLRHRVKVVITAPHGIIGSLYSCPLCGIIDEQYNNLEHVIKPSKPLLNYLVSLTK